MLLRAIVLLVLFVGTARADDASYAAAEKKKGDVAMDERRYEDALSAYDRAYMHSNDPVLQYNRGRALQFLARNPEALDAMEQFEKNASPELRAKVPGLPTLLADLRQRVATLDVRCDVPNARILVSSMQVATTPVDKPLHVNAGQIVVEVIAEGYRPYRREVDAQGGATTRVDVVLESKNPKPLAPLGNIDRQLPSTDKPTPITSKAWFWATVVSVAVVVGVGLSFGIYALTTERAADRGDLAPGQIPFP